MSQNVALGLTLIAFTSWILEHTLSASTSSYLQLASFQGWLAHSSPHSIWCEMLANDGQMSNGSHTVTCSTIFQPSGQCVMAIMTVWSDSLYTFPKWSNYIVWSNFPLQGIEYSPHRVSVEAHCTVTIHPCSSNLPYIMWHPPTDKCVPPLLAAWYYLPLYSCLDTPDSTEAVHRPDLSSSPDMGSVLHWSHIDLEYAAAPPRPNTENTLTHQTWSQVSWVDSLPV